MGDGDIFVIRRCTKNGPVPKQEITGKCGDVHFATPSPHATRNDKQRN